MIYLDVLPSAVIPSMFLNSIIQVGPEFVFSMWCCYMLDITIDQCRALTKKLMPWYLIIVWIGGPGALALILKYGLTENLMRDD